MITNVSGEEGIAEVPTSGTILFTPETIAPNKDASYPSERKRFSTDTSG